MAQGKKTRRAEGDPLGKEKRAGNEKPHFGIFYLHEALHMADYFARAVHEELAEHAAVGGTWVTHVSAENTIREPVALGIS